MQKLRVGIVGLGFIGMRHIDAIRRIPGVEVVAVADFMPERARQVAEQFGIEHAFGSVEEMLEKGNVDAVHNCTPTNMHYPVSKKVIEAGKALYCEKPLGLNADEGHALVELLKTIPVPNAVNLNYRMNAMAQETAARIRSGEGGRPLMVTASYVQDWMMKQDDCDWRLDPKIGGASRAVADIGSHLFDTVQHITGKHIVAINCDMTRVYDKRLKYKKTDTFSKEKGELIGEVDVCNEDAASIMAKLEDGTTALFQVSQISAGHKNDIRFRFDMSECSYEWQQERSDLLFIGHRDEPNQVMYREASALHPDVRRFSTLPSGHSEGWNDALYNAIHAFYASIQDDSWKSGNVPYATIADGAYVLSIVDACLKSNETHAWVNVNV